MNQKIEHKAEIFMLCVLKRLPNCFGRGLKTPEQKTCFLRTWESQYLQLRQNCFPLPADEHQFDLKDQLGSTTLISYIDNGPDMMLFASAEVIWGTDRKCCSLENVMVHETQRGQGLTKQVIPPLLRAMVQQGYQFCHLLCRPEDAGLYERYGFFQVAAPDEVTFQQLLV